MTIGEIDLWVSIEQILTPEEFHIFEMRHKFKMNQEQIAAEMEITQPAVFKRLSKIKKKLKYWL